MKLNLKNQTSISKRKIDKNGFMSIPATLARSGIYEYYTSEVVAGLSNKNLPATLKNKLPSDTFKILYPDEALFNSKMNFDFTPVTDDHPEDFITPENITKFQKGIVKNGVKRDANNLVGEVLVQDQKLINQITAKKKEELSTGVSGQIDFTAGVDSVHGNYDAKYINIDINHIAVVEKGRAGNSVRLSNKNKEVKNMKKITINGVGFDFEDQSAQVVENLITHNSEMRQKLKTSNESVKQLQEEVDKSSGKIKALEADLKNTDKLEAMVEERAELINTVKSIDKDVETSGVSNSDIMRSFVAKNSKVEIDESNDAVVEGIFKHMVATNAVKKEKSTDDTHLKNADKEESAYVKSRNAYRKKTQDLNKKVGA